MTDEQVRAALQIVTSIGKDADEDVAKLRACAAKCLYAWLNEKDPKKPESPK